MNKYYMAQLYDFLRRLDANNNRDWFKANRTEYDELRQLWLNDLDRLIALMAQWDPALATNTAKGAAYRIYRDTRFSQDKTPLKTYFSASVSPRGRAPHYGGYYLQLGPGSYTTDVDSGLYGGIWCPDAPTLKKLRKAIIDNIEEFEEILANPALEREFPGWCASALKTVPKGYDKKHPYAHLLRLKEFGKFHPCNEAFFCDPCWPEKTSELFRLLKPMVDFLNYSVDEEVY